MCSVACVRLVACTKCVCLRVSSFSEFEVSVSGSSLVRVFFAEAKTSMLSALEEGSLIAPA